MTAWLWTALAVVLLVAASALLAERTITWRLPAAMALAPASYVSWWLARRSGAEYTLHGVVWDVTAGLTTIAIGLVLGEQMTVRRALAAVLGICAVVLAADGGR